MQIIQQIKQIGDLTKFSLTEACADSNGKSTLMPVLGAFTTIIGGIGFLWSLAIKNSEFGAYSTFVIGIGGAYFGIRKIVNGKPEKEDTIVETTK